MYGSVVSHPFQKKKKREIITHSVFKAIKTQVLGAKNTKASHFVMRDALWISPISLIPNGISVGQDSPIQAM
jgi:hypothetical protein